ASHIRYALTFNPTVHVSHIRQFWSTARIEITEEGTKILATVYGQLRTVSESSIRRNLKLNDKAGISSLLDAELFENLQLMGYNTLPNQKFTFQKGQFSHQWKYLIHTIMQCLSPKSTGFNEFSSNIATALCLSPKSTGFNEFSSNIATALVCLATNRVYNFSKMIFDDEPTSPLGDDSQGEAFPTDSGFEADQDRANIAKTSTLPSDSVPKVTSLAADEGNEPASPVRDVSKGEACPTDSGFIASQDRATIAKSSTLPHDSTSRVTFPAVDEGSMQQPISELMALCTSLQRQHSELLAKFQAQEVEILRLKERVQVLEDRESVAAK
nr:hypothetical protein [Tanacetum cinerariifolium]